MNKPYALALTLLAFSFSQLKSQNFGYSLQTDSSEYTMLSSSIDLLLNESFKDKHPGIHLPFSFNFCGTEIDSVAIETNGFLIFSNPSIISIVAFNNFSGNRDSLGYYPASVSYRIDGGIGNRIARIEFKKFSLSTYGYFDNLSYQIWLYENGNILEYHIGTNSFSTLEVPVLLGLINRNMNTENKALLVTGNPASPSALLISEENELQYLTSVPRTGIIYRLIPTF